MIVPTVFTTSIEEFDTRLHKVLSLSDRIHIDLMDGLFVPSRSPSVDELPDLSNFDKHFEAHLMVQDPISWLEKCKDKGFASIAFHIEPLTQEQVLHVIEKCKQLGLEPTPTKNAQTPLEDLQPHLKNVSSILLMGIQAGIENQSFQEQVYHEIRTVRNDFPHVTIGIDGGVSDSTVTQLASAGATILCSGSFINKAPDPRQAYNTLTQLFDAGE